MSKNQIIKDEYLLKQFCNGNTIAFEKLYSRYYAKLLYYLIQTLKNKETAKDILQEVFIKIVENKCKFNFDKKFSVWIYSIASNTCKNYFKHNKIVQKAEKEIIYNSSVLYNPDNIKKEKKKIIKLAINKIDTKHQQVFILRNSFSFSFSEIAEILEISEGTVKSRMFNTVKKIKEYIHKNHNEYSKL